MRKVRARAALIFSPFSDNTPAAAGAPWRTESSAHRPAAKCRAGPIGFGFVCPRAEPVQLRAGRGPGSPSGLKTRLRPRARGVPCAFRVLQASAAMADSQAAAFLARFPVLQPFPPRRSNAFRVLPARPAPRETAPSRARRNKVFSLAVRRGRAPEPSASAKPSARLRRAGFPARPSAQAHNRSQTPYPLLPA